jgi:hypothetical protein
MLANWNFALGNWIVNRPRYIAFLINAPLHKFLILRDFLSEWLMRHNHELVPQQ